MVADRCFAKPWSSKILSVAIMVAGILVLAPSAQTQELPTVAPTTDVCSPNPATVGETIICTITVTNPFPGASDFALIGKGLDIGTTGATIVSADSPDPEAVCSVNGPQIGECRTFSPIPSGGSFTAVFEIEAQAPGVLTDVAFTQVNMPFPGGPDAGGASARGDARTSVTVLPPSSSVPPQPSAPEPQPSAPAPQPSAPSPVTQDSDQESEAGEIDQSFEVS
ncbi:MAG: hypothetical protein AVDCRST_MAG28-3901 [uncultured Rubrobacteraceae bacterium]|uniref:DUF11 domain-containing protein n=1 Tax=uncultured Rubrobacteraceae bacterium TaxID=349277 RepID=A0A6J4R5F1_9ACTN|nr:MAG: hypothetical protein AVDCRST_MAG28-3901 [uncultured Rubrobacteraceae bacterium]